MKFGIDSLLTDSALLDQLRAHRVALLAHPASMTGAFVHSLDALAAHRVPLTAALGPQHGIRGDKQDNMVETGDAFDEIYRIPVFSLYGKTRRLAPRMLDTFDILLVDLQDVGCRIYTFLTTLLYILEDCAESGKAVWVLDRPNPAGREIEGSLLTPGCESFVGVAPMPMRHGLTLGEAADWYRSAKNLNVDLKIIEMQGYDPRTPPGFGWPTNRFPWVNPSPNIATLNAVRAFPGTVLLEGTTLSEGRGTTRALELVGAPDLDISALLPAMERTAPSVIEQARLRPCGFEPTFHKHAGTLCFGFQIHTDLEDFDPALFKPYRLIAVFFKCLREQVPDYPLWRDFEYEYVSDRLAIDVIDGGAGLRNWVDDPQADFADLHLRLLGDESEWLTESSDFHRY